MSKQSWENVKAIKNNKNWYDQTRKTWDELNLKIEFEKMETNKNTEMNWKHGEE